MPVLALSAQQPGDTGYRIGAFPVSAYQVKPFPAGRLADCLVALLRRYRAYKNN